MSAWLGAIGLACGLAFWLLAWRYKREGNRAFQLALDRYDETLRTIASGPGGIAQALVEKHGNAVCAALLHPRYRRCDSFSAASVALDVLVVLARGEKWDPQS